MLKSIREKTPRGEGLSFLIVKCQLYLEYEADADRGSVHVERLSQLKDGLGGNVRWVHDEDEVEKVLADAAQHAGEGRPKHLLGSGVGKFVRFGNNTTTVSFSLYYLFYKLS